MGRIIDYPEITSLSDSDYLIVDNEEAGTRKVLAQSVAGVVDPVPTEDSMNAVRSDGVWSALNDISDEFDTLKNDAYGVYPLITTYSSLVDISAGADNVPLKYLQSYIRPVMSGSGMPSRSNVRDITGYSEINIYHAAKNLIRPDLYQESPEKVLLGVSTADELIFLKAGTYSISVLMKNENVTVTPYWKLGETEHHSQSITLTEDSSISIYVYDENGFDSNTIESFQLELGSSVTTHEAYEGEIISVAFPSSNAPVYFGSVDVVNGKLIIDAILYERNSAMMNNAEDKPGWTNTGLESYDVRVGTFDTAVYWEDLSTVRYTQVNVGSVYSVESVNDIYSLILPVSTYGLSQSQWISLGIDIQVLVSLDTPIEIDIDAEEIRTLLGRNIFYSNSQDTRVSYRMDLLTYIDSDFTVTRDSILTAFGYDVDDDLVDTNRANTIASDVFFTEIAKPTFLATDNMSKSVIQNAFGIDAPIVAPSTIESTTVLINRLNPRTWFVWLNGAEVEFSRLGVSLNATNNAITLYLHGRTSMCTGIMGVDNAWTVTTL